MILHDGDVRHFTAGAGRGRHHGMKELRAEKLLKAEGLDGLDAAGNGDDRRFRRVDDAAAAE